ncbi:MAG: hypothetical protein HYS83_02505 [Candidatus Blackburnbacteria bacterium]|nr:hypothetical protein [Candidatus Blackburnbacteria bacterium]
MEARKATSVLARQEDGTVQITITIPQDIVRANKEKALKHLVENLEVPGFRKGKAPQDVALKHIETQKLYEHMLQHILPEVYATAVEEYKLKPVLAPRFELVTVDENKDWQIRAITCELPEINLGDYKQTIKGFVVKAKIWVPGKGDTTNPPSPTQSGQDGPTKEEKEQEIVKTLIEKTEVKIPRLLIEEEVNHRLSRLLEQVQKLGLTIEQYLSSTSKKVEQLREEYAKQAEDSIKLELSLNKVAQEEKVEVLDSEVDEVIQAMGDEAAKEALSTPYQKRLIRDTLLRRKALDRLANLV